MMPNLMMPNLSLKTILLHLISPTLGSCNKIPLTAYKPQKFIFHTSQVEDQDSSRFMFGKDSLLVSLMAGFFVKILPEERSMGSL